MPGNPGRQNLNGPLSGMVKVSIVNMQGMVRNFNAKNAAYQRAVDAVNRAWGEEAKTHLQSIVPFDLGNMHDLVDLRFTAKNTGYELGWRRKDFLAANLRWYVPYVLFGTSRMPARPVHEQTQAAIWPRHRAALAQALRDATERT